MAQIIGSVLGVQPVSWSDVHKYGIVSSASTGTSTGALVCRVESLVEKPPREKAPSNLAVLGRYVLEAEVFAVLERTRPGSGGEIQLTDALNELAQTRAVWAYIFSGRRYDVGDKLGFLEATVEYALRREELARDFAEYLSRMVRETSRRLKRKKS